MSDELPPASTWHFSGTATRERPLVSIITATMNVAETLPYTIRSLASQIGAHFEWVVVDGGSKDRTTELLRECQAVTMSWLSEPDCGIYDAWNKACRQVKGEWVLFLGAGDELPDSTALARMSAHIANAFPRFAVVYGRVEFISEGRREPLFVAGEPWENLRDRWEIGRPALPPHSGVFHHRSLVAKEKPFDPHFRLAGDSHLLLRHLTRNPSALFVPLTINRTPVGGASMRLDSVILLHREIAEINRALGIKPPFWHRVGDRIAWAGKIVASILPAPLANRVGDAYRTIVGKPRMWSAR